MEYLLSILPAVTIHTNPSTISVKDVFKFFHPRNKDYRDAKFDEDYIARKENNTRYHIPEHQRFFVWTLKQQNNLIDTILRNYPIPDVIVSDTEVRGVFHMEDGQQRFTTLWRFCHNLFPYVPSDYVGDNPPHIYYNNIPDNAPSNSYKLEDISVDAKSQLDNYRINITEIQTEEDLENRKEIICEIFERLNSGKQLTDGDKIWNRKDTPVAKYAIDISLSDDVQPLLKRVFNIDIRKIINPSGKGPSKKSLCSIVGMVLGLSTSMNVDTWANVMTTSFSKISSHLYNDITNKLHVKQGLITICKILDENRGNDQISTSQHASFNRHLGIMIYDWRQRIEEYNCEHNTIVPEYIIEEFNEFWIPVIEYFQNSSYDLDDGDHPITSLYVDGDRKNKNTDIGANIASRHSQLMIKVSEWNM